MNAPYTWVWAAAPETGWLRSVDLPYPRITVGPDEEAEQFVAFDVDDHARLTRLRLGPFPENAVVWVIG